MLSDTRTVQAAAFEEAGAQGAALEFLLGATAAHRASIRAERTWAAALDAAEGSQALAVALCLADKLGVGGPRFEASGAGTARLPAFKALGKGRKGASDGPAWMAALDAVLCQHARGLRVAAVLLEEAEAGSPALAGLIVQVDSPDGSVDVLQSVDLVSEPRDQDDPLHPAWLREVAIQGLRQAAGLPATRTDVPGQWQGDVAAWSAVYNWANERLQAHVLSLTRVEHVLAEARGSGTWAGETLAWAEVHRDATLAEMAALYPEPVQWLRDRKIIM